MGEYQVNDEQPTADQEKSLHKLIKKVTQDIENFSYNTSIAAFMIAVGELQKCHSKSVQFCGKTRFTIQLPANVTKEDAEKAALADERTAKYTEGKQIVKTIVVPGRIINIVVK